MRRVWNLGGNDKALLCVDCSHAYHTFCPDPPLDGIPGADWVCPDCATSAARARPEKQQQRRPPKRTQTRAHSGSNKRARGSASLSGCGQRIRRYLESS